MYIVFYCHSVTAYHNFNVGEFMPSPLMAIVIAEYHIFLSRPQFQSDTSTYWHQFLTGLPTFL